MLAGLTRSIWAPLRERRKLAGKTATAVGLASIPRGRQNQMVCRGGCN